jgi:hypothetical protein
MVDKFYRYERSSQYDPPPHRFSLLRICRQIYQESAAFPCQMCIFRFFDIKGLHAWVTRASAEERRAVGTIQFGLRNSLTSLNSIPLRQLENGIDKLPNLNLVEIQYCMSGNVTDEEHELTLEVLGESKEDVEEEDDVHDIHRPKKGGDASSERLHQATWWTTRKPRDYTPRG